MKKLFLLLSILLSVGLLVSCSDESSESVAENSITVTFDNVAVVNGVVYATKDYPLKINSMVLSSSDGETKCISEAKYSIDSQVSDSAHYTPFSGRINTTDIPVGNHTLELAFDLLQNDNSSVPDDIVYSIVVVDDLSDLPQNAELGTLTRTFRATHA
ncbi:MAG: hypothetical protein K2N05_07855 [Muribaculaceae bacterium]|nr:hypothetical protein [Muribaculaceae bacterium]